MNHQETIIDHGATFLPFNAALCRATWRYDRLYALASNAGGPTVGRATTQPRDIGGHRLWVNFVTRPPKKSNQPGLDEGLLQAELLDAEGQVLAGFAREDCKPLRGEALRALVRWEGGKNIPANARRVRFYLRRAFLYGLEFTPPPSPPKK